MNNFYYNNINAYAIYMYIVTSSNNLMHVKIVFSIQFKDSRRFLDLDKD